MSSQSESTTREIFIRRRIKLTLLIVAVGLLMSLGPAAVRAGGIAGTIRDAATGLPLAGIDLDLFNATFASVAINATTAADGTYLFSPVPAGDYFVRADPTALQGYVDQYTPGVFLKSQAGTVAVPTFGTIIVNFNLQTGSSISGTITNAATGLPVVAMDLDIYAADRSFLGSVNASSGLDGTYSLGRLPAGDYFVRADPETTTYLMNYYLDQRKLSLATPLLVDGVTNVAGIDFSMVLGGTISGVLTDRLTAAPLDSIDIDVFDMNGLFLSAYNARSALDGTFTVGPMPPGNYLVQADPVAAGTYVDTYYGDVYAQSLAVPLTVSPGQATVGANISLPRGGTISGFVTAQATGAPLLGTRISVFDSLGGIVPGFGTSTAADGSYQVGALPQGNYFVRAKGDTTSGLAFQFYPNVSLSSLAQAIPVRDGVDIAGVNMALQPGGWLQGTVRELGTGLPLALIDLDVYSPAFEFVGALNADTDANGNFRIGPVPAGDYLVRAQPVLGEPLQPQYFDHSATAVGAVSTTALALLTSGGLNFDLVSAVSAVDLPGFKVGVARLVSIYPNPFNPQTRVEFEAPEAGFLRLAIYDISGRRVSTLVSEFVSAGHHNVQWLGVDDDGRAVASGIYFARLESAMGTDLTKLVLVR